MQRKQRLSPEEVDTALARAHALFNGRPTAVLEAARDYVLQRGWPIIPLPLSGNDRNAGKKPTLKDWPNLRITTEAHIDQHFLNRLVNVGGILGSPSNNLTDIDLDCQEAIDLADQYLPRTGSVFGRASKPRSHHLYLCTGVALTRAFRDPIDENMIVELRGDTRNGKPGMQTVLPGSIHVISGELIEWEEDGEQLLIDYVELHQHVMNLAMGVLVVRYCPGVRTDAEFQQALAKADPRVRKRLDWWKTWQQEVERVAPAKPAPSRPQPSPKQTPIVIDAAVEQPALPPPTDHEVARLYTALTYTDSRDRDEIWLPFGGAIHDLAGWPEDLRRALWRWWSIHMDPAPEPEKKYNEADQEKTWASFARDYKAKRATKASIFKRAQKNGWDNCTLKPLPEELRVLVPPSVEVKATAAGDALMAAAERLFSMSFADRMLLRRKVAVDYGVTVGDLDRLLRIIEKSKEGDDGGDNLQGQALNFAEPEPWPKPVDGHELVGEIVRAIRHNVVLPSHYLFVSALWAIHTYMLDELKCTPRLIIGAATEGCGKSTLVDVLSYLVWRPLRTIGLTPAALFRAIDKYKPVLLLDEASRTFDAEHGAAHDLLNLVIAILDAGFQPGRSIIRAVGEEHEVHEFFVYSPVCRAVFNKTKLPNTLVTRSIHVPLKKKLKSERAVPFSLYHDVEPLQQLAQKIRRWCDDNRERACELLIARIEHERADDGTADDEALTNRLADKWRPLFAIAEATGYLPEAQDVAAELAKADAVRGEAESDFLGVPLLADCRHVFEMLKVDWISADRLEIELRQMDDRPWRGFGLLGITKHMIAKILSDFDIRPQRPRTPEGRQYAYARAQFEEAWARNLPSPDTILGEAANKYSRRAADDMWQKVI
jgi:putative DNA primase/helicase